MFFSQSQPELMPFQSPLTMLLPTSLRTHLVNTVNKVISWGQQMVSNASTAVSNMLSKVSSVPAGADAVPEPADDVAADLFDLIGQRLQPIDDGVEELLRRCLPK